MNIPLKEPPSKSTGANHGLAGFAILSFGFRPFFMLASAYAALALVVWIGALMGWLSPPFAMAPADWHIHEMLFGFAAAGLAGFLLTAVANWTGREPVRGAPLAGLSALWLAGRLAVTRGQDLSPGMVAAMDLPFLATLTLVFGREVMAGGNRRNYPIIAAVAFLTLANGLTHAEAFGLEPEWMGVGQRLGMHVYILLIILIGGRIIPAFTGNWLKKTGRPGEPVTIWVFELAVLGIAIVAAVSDTMMPGGPVTSGIFIVVGGLHLIRLGRWRGLQTLSEPIVWILHLGYLWVGVGCVLLGLSGLDNGVSRVAAVHALTAGAIGTMFLAMMTRATLGHTGRALEVGPGTVMAYVLVTLAAVSRVIAPWWDTVWVELMIMSAGTWIAGFGLFFALYFPLWVKPRAP